MFGHYRLLVGIIVLAVCLDQGSKALATMDLGNGEEIPLIDGLLELRLRHNRGVAWGVGASLPVVVQRIAFPVVGLLIGAALVAYYRRLTGAERARQVAVALMIGGGAGNLIDRVRGGYVIDFISVYFGGAGWAMSGTFNLGDAWMVGGLVILLITTSSGRGRRSRAMVDKGSP